MLDVISIGTATRDVFLKVPGIKVLKDPEHLKKLGFIAGEAECMALGSKLEVEEPLLTIGGGATNSAVTFSRQGLKTAAIITIGDDENGKAVLAALKKEKVKPLVVYSPKEQTAYSTILLSSSAERTILVYRGAANDLDEKQISWDLLKAKWAYIAPGAIDLSVMRKIFYSLKNSGTRIAMNPSGYYLKQGLQVLQPFLDDCDVVILNQEEASLLTSIPLEDEKSLLKKMDDIISGLLLMTNGRKGSVVADGKNIYRAGIFPDHPIDRTGTGDAFGSGFVSVLAKTRKEPPYDQETIKEAIRFGTANATSKIEHIGAQSGILTAKEFKSDERWKNFSVLVEPA